MREVDNFSVALQNYNLRRALCVYREIVVLKYEEMPDDNYDLSKIEIDFSHVSFERVSEPKEIEPYLLDYLEREGYLPDGNLYFLRTAQVADIVYWIWEFESDGDKTYATATQDSNGDTSLGCDTDYYGLSPEQYILGDYHNCF